MRVGLGQGVAVVLGSALLGCTFVVAPTCMALAGLDDDEISTAEAECSGAPRSGVTACSPGECGPEQYCDESSGERVCRPGCASDENCSSMQRCVRSGEAAIGRCEACRE